MSIKPTKSNKKVYETKNKIIEENEEEPISLHNSKEVIKDFSGRINKTKEKENDRYDDDEDNQDNQENQENQEINLNILDKNELKNEEEEDEDDEEEEDEEEEEEEDEEKEGNKNEDKSNNEEFKKEDNESGESDNMGKEDEINTNIQWEESPKEEKKNSNLNINNIDLNKPISEAHELDFNSNFVDEEKENNDTNINTNKSMRTNLTNKLNNIHSNIFSHQPSIELNPKIFEFNYNKDDLKKNPNTNWCLSLNSFEIFKCCMGNKDYHKDDYIKYCAVCSKKLEIKENTIICVNCFNYILMFDLILNKMDDDCLDDIINKIMEDHKYEKSGDADYKIELRKMIWNEFNFLTDKTYDEFSIVIRAIGRCHKCKNIRENAYFKLNKISKEYICLNCYIESAKDIVFPKKKGIKDAVKQMLQGKMINLP